MQNAIDITLDADTEGTPPRPETTIADVRPLQDRVLVLRDAAEEISRGGIHLPEKAAAKEPPVLGLVVAVGDGKVLEDGRKLTLDVKKGDRVIFGRYAGSDILIGSEAYLILREDEILAVTED